MTPISGTFEKVYAPRGRLTVAVRDLTAAPTDGIVSPSNGGLAPGGGLAEQVLREAGPELAADCERIIESRGRIETTRAALTGAGRLPYRGILHAVGPRLVDEGVADRLTATFLHCLELAEQAGWRSLAFPAISTGIFGVPRRDCASALDRALARHFAGAPVLDQVWMCLTEDAFDEFASVLCGDAIEVLASDSEAGIDALEPAEGVWEIDEDELAGLTLDDLKLE